MKRYNSPINSSRSISNKPPTGRLQSLSSSNRDTYESSSNKKLSPIQDKKFYSSKKSSRRSDDEDNNNDDNDIYRGGKNNNRFNSDSNDENFDKKKLNGKSKSKYGNFDDDDEDDYKSKQQIKKKNSARLEKLGSDNENSNDEKRHIGSSNYDFDSGEKKSYSKFDSGTKLGNLSNRNNYEDIDFDKYRSKSKADDFLSNKKLTDSLRLEQEAVNQEYEKLYNSTKYDDLRATQKLGLKSPKSTDPLYNRSQDILPNNKIAIPLPPPGPTRGTSLDRVGMYNSAYNSTNNLSSSTGRNKFNSSNNLNHFETMSDKSTSSLNGTNLSIREAKSKYV